MNRREFLGAGIGVIGAAMAERLPDSGPNILFVLTDDQAQWAAGCYGNTDICTPNIDRLAAGGMRFTRAFTCPVCSPSRAMLMTGCYNHQLGIEDWIAPAESVGLPANVPTLAEELRRLGYETALFGKWHLGHARPELLPTARGFDQFVGFLRGSSNYMNPTLVSHGQSLGFKGPLADILADRALEFLRTPREKPFALFYQPFNPHAPYGPVPENDLAPYEGRSLTVPAVEGVAPERLKDISRKYYASVTHADRNFGRLLDELDKQQLAARTLVVFASDNGYNIGQHGLWHKGNGTLLATNQTRSNMFDTSSLVPLIVRLPGVVPTGRVCEEMVCSIDWLPTVLDLLGARRRPGLLLEGMSFGPLLRGESTPWRDELCLAYNQHHYLPRARMRMIRTREWKLVLHREAGAEHELYNLTKDPGEAVNVYGAPAARTVQEDLTRRLVLWEKRTGA